MADHPTLEVTGTHTARVASQSQRLWYAVDLADRDGKGSCSCKGFGYRKTCSHLEYARAAMSGQEPLIDDAPLQPFDLYTSRYMNRDRIVESGLVPVGITVGKPRFVNHLPYAGDLVYVDEAAPRGLLDEKDQAAFYEQYVELLESVGVDFFKRKFSALSAANDGRGLVLLCYEDLSVKGEWCHRQIFSAWWGLRTNQAVIELPGPPVQEALA